MAKKILIVDDERSLVQLIMPMLKAKGYEVVAGYDGEDGFNKAKSENPDLIILDIMLPKMNGFEICRLLKFNSTYEQIPVIMLSAKASEKDKEIATDVKADAYIVKPYEPEVLLNKIAELLNKNA